MEKALETPANVLIYKQHWDHYNKSPALMEKLRVEQPIQHHLIQHFRNNFWHLVVKREPEQQQLPPAVSPPSQTMPERHQADSFTAQFHGGADTGAEELSSILGTSSAPTPSPVPPTAAPDRLTPLMLSRPHVCARMASGVLVKLDPNNPQVRNCLNQSQS